MGSHHITKHATAYYLHILIFVVLRKKRPFKFYLIFYLIFLDRKDFVQDNIMYLFYLSRLKMWAKMCKLSCSMAVSIMYSEIQKRIQINHHIIKTFWQYLIWNPFSKMITCLHITLNKKERKKRFKAMNEYLHFALFLTELVKCDLKW